MLEKLSPAGGPSGAGEGLAAAARGQVRMGCVYGRDAGGQAGTVAKTAFPLPPLTLWASPGGISLLVKYLKNYFY